MGANTGSNALNYNKYYDGSYDKQHSSYAGISAASARISNYVDETLTLLGNRPPMYVIGEVSGEAFGDLSAGAESAVGKNIAGAVTRYINDPSSGLVARAVSTIAGNKQEGVIIDGLGNAAGEFSVNFTANPMYYMADSAIDARYRNPARLTMTVMVSNHLSDNIFGMATETVSNMDPTGLTGYTLNQIAYGGNTRSQNALYKLRWLIENAKPFTVYTPHGYYENMLIKSIRPQTDASKMEMLYCEIEFQEIIFYHPYDANKLKTPTRRGIESTGSGITGTLVSKASNLIKGGTK